MFLNWWLGNFPLWSNSSTATNQRKLKLLELFQRKLKGTGREKKSSHIRFDEEAEVNGTEQKKVKLMKLNKMNRQPRKLQFQLPALHAEKFHLLRSPQNPQVLPASSFRERIRQESAARRVGPWKVAQNRARMLQNARTRSFGAWSCWCRERSWRSRQSRGTSPRRCTRQQSDCDWLGNCKRRQQFYSFGWQVTQKCGQIQEQNTSAAIQVADYAAKTSEIEQKPADVFDPYNTIAPSETKAAFIEATIAPATAPRLSATRMSGNRMSTFTKSANKPNK